jgi:hypothetical protein
MLSESWGDAPGYGDDAPLALKRIQSTRTATRGYPNALERQRRGIQVSLGQRPRYPGSAAPER